MAGECVDEVAHFEATLDAPLSTVERRLVLRFAQWQLRAMKKAFADGFARAEARENVRTRRRTTEP